MEIFSKKLTKTDIEGILSMKSRSLASFPGFGHGQHTLVLRVEDDGGKKWFFRLIIRKGRYKKPVISGGWLRCVKSKNLQVGDEVQFLKEEDEAKRIKYKIKVKKPVKLFKSVIGYCYI